MQVLEATVGGTRRYLLDLAYNLPADQFDQHLVVSTTRDSAFEKDITRLRQNDLHVSVVPMRRKISPLSDLQAFFAIRALIRSWKPHVIHSHSSKAGFIARMAARSSRAANLYSPHCFAFQMQISPLQRLLYIQLERWAGRFTDCLVLPCPSQQHVATKARIVPADRIVVIPTGVQVSDFVSKTGTEQMRQELGIGQRQAVIGTVAALTKQKGHIYLLEAVAKVVKRSDAVLLLAGHGDKEVVLQELAQRLEIADRVQFLGQRDDIPRLLGALDLFVLPSLWEGLSYSLLEAMATGVPVVTTDISGSVDLIDGNTTGWLVQPANAPALADAIIAALANPDEARHRSQNARQLVQSQYSIENMMNKYIHLYTKAAKKADEE